MFTYRARLNLSAFPQLIMYTTAGFGLGCSLMAIWLASSLHRTQTIMFVDWVKTFRLPPNASQGRGYCVVRREEEGEAEEPRLVESEYRRVMEAYLMMQVSVKVRKACTCLCTIMYIMYALSEYYLHVINTYLYMPRYIFCPFANHGRVMSPRCSSPNPASAAARNSPSGEWTHPHTYISINIHESIFYI